MPELKDGDTDINLNKAECDLSREINKYLGTLVKIPSGKPKYRLVYTEDMLELRDKIWQRKYNYMKDRWVIECWFPPEKYKNVELPLTLINKGYYEPMYVFESNYRPLPLNKHVVEIIMLQVLNRAPQTIAQRLQEIDAQMAAKDQKMDQYVMEYLNEDSDLAGALHDGDAVFIPDFSAKREDKQ